MWWLVVFDGPGPIYLQIAAYLREQIVSGTLVGGDQVMSTTQFAATYRINPATAGKALAALVSEGLLVKRRGLGMFVTPEAQELLLAERRAVFLTDVLDPFLREADLVGYSRGDVVELVRERVVHEQQQGQAQSSK